MSADGPVTLLYRPRCPFAAILRARLTLARIPYELIRFRDDEVVAARARGANDGNEVSPTVLVGDRSLTNPSVAAVRAARAALPGRG